MTFIDDIKFDDKGLVPAIIQDYKTNEVLMMAYMNRESLEKTIATKVTWFYSRSKQRLWNKGESSKNYQRVKELSYDCDGDCILVKVQQQGWACHTGNYSCFHNTALDSVTNTGPTCRDDVSPQGNPSSQADIIYDLYKLIKSRKEAPQNNSYTCYLFREGLDKILKKVGEESSEVIIASKNTAYNRNPEETISEISDLIYHLLVLMVELGISIESIEDELYRRS